MKSIHNCVFLFVPFWFEITRLAIGGSVVFGVHTLWIYMIIIMTTTGVHALYDMMCVCEREGER